MGRASSWRYQAFNGSFPVGTMVYNPSLKCPDREEAAEVMSLSSRVQAH